MTMIRDRKAVRDGYRLIVVQEFVDRGGTCMRCEEDDIACIHWHHLDPTAKEKTIGQLIKDGGPAKIRAELAKCIPLCANCHMKLHAGRWKLEELIACIAAGVDEP